MRKAGHEATRFGRALLLVLATSAGCASASAMFSTPENRKVVVPDEMLRQSDYTPEGTVPRSRYVVRMSDGHRDWEVEFPEVANGYEVRIPLEGEPKSVMQPEGAAPTAADREILDDMVRQSTEPAVDGREGVAKGPPRERPRPQTSYLATMAEIRELFRTRNYEVALVKAVDLEKQYPADDRLLGMKGSLYLRLGRPELARESWEKALKLNPQNQVVIDALSRMQPGSGSAETPR